RRPALIAAFTDASGELLQAKRIFLTFDGKKAPLEKPKKMMPLKNVALAGGSIKLFAATDELAIAERIGTALAFAVRYGVPTWAAYSAAMMSKVVIPQSVRTLYALADNDVSQTG